MVDEFKTPWGISAFDEAVGGLPSHTLNVLETQNYQTGLMALGHFLWKGLQSGEKCALVTFENPLSFIEAFEAWNFKFYDYLKSEQFIFLSYKPNITQEVGLTQKYDGLFDEINRLANDAPHRIAIHQMDTLFNLQSPMLINSCSLKIVTALANTPSTILGQFVRFEDPTYNNIRISCLKHMSGYFSILPTEKNNHTFDLKVERIPNFEVVDLSIPLKLEKGVGLVGLDVCENINGKVA